MRENISSPPQDPLERMLLLLNGHCLEQALYVAAVLGIADLLVGGNKSSSELATCTGADEPSLYRLLRTLASAGIFSEDESCNFCTYPSRDHFAERCAQLDLGSCHVLRCARDVQGMGQPPA